LDERKVKQNGNKYGTFEVGQADTLVDAGAFWIGCESEHGSTSLMTVKKLITHVWPHLVF
jgi:hypothetical protein